MDLTAVTLPANAFVDVCRILVGLAGVIVFLFALVRFLNHAAFWGSMAFMCFGLVTSFQEAEQIGSPTFVPWRLPLLALGNAAAAVYLYRESVDARP